MAILCDVKVGSGSGEYYGTLVVSNLRQADGGAVKVSQFLSINFQSPAAVSGGDIYQAFDNWVEVSTEAKSNAVSDGVFEVAATVRFDTAHSMAAGDQFTISVNGDLTAQPDTWLKSFVIVADQASAVAGTVSVSSAACPDAALAQLQPTFQFTLGNETTLAQPGFGGSTSVSLSRGVYAVSGVTLTTADQCTSATLLPTPASISVVPGQSVAVSSRFGAVQRHAALDVVFGKLDGLAGEVLQVTVVDKTSKKQLAAFTAQADSSTSLFQLPASGVALVQVAPLSINNVHYSFTDQSVTLANKKLVTTIGNAAVKTSAVSATGFVNLPLTVTADSASGKVLNVRLVSSGMAYVMQVAASSQRVSFPCVIKPDTYSVEVSNFIESGIVHAVTAPAQLVVQKDGSTLLALKVTRSANLNVRGFPAYLSFGGCADLTPGNVPDFVEAKTSSIFIYAGVDGMGDATLYLADDVQTRTTFNMARDVEAKIDQPGHLVLPVIISYTTNLSLGDTPTKLADAKEHAYSFGNYIQALKIANEYIDAEHPVPGGFIVNPDFLGACQQGGFAADYKMPVRAPLQEALNHHAINTVIPAYITEDIKGYVAAVNWVTHTIAPDVTFGWQVNLWGVGYSEWIYGETAEEVIGFAQSTADYIESVGAYSGPCKPDFLAIDRYEADDLTIRAYANGYCYSPHEWHRFWDFCEALSLALKLPVMPWQIPSGRIPLSTDQVDTDFNPQHWGTAGSCLFGDPDLGSDYTRIHPNVLALAFPDAFKSVMTETVASLFQRATPFDVSAPYYTDFPLRGIFCVSLGGGATTGMVSAVGNPEAWVRQKLADYARNPVQFK